MTIAYGIVKIVASGRRAFILIRTVLVYHHQIIGRTFQIYGNLIRTYLTGVATSWLCTYDRTQNLLYSFNPTRFEKFVADVFRANYTNTEIVHVGKPNDGGIDVLLIDAEMEQWLIQVKHRETQNSTEGVSTIRDILGAMVVKGARRGIVVSTAKRFSRYAIQAAAKAEVGPHRMTVQLVDSGIFNKMLDPILLDRPWLLPITQLDAELAGYLADQIPSNNQLELFTTTQLFQLN